jgi:tetratricopeptide (TPR) repeat protein
MTITADEMAAAAWAAMARRESDEALHWWSVLRDAFPDHPEGHIRPVQVLWQAGRLDEAKELAAKIDARFSRHPELLAQRAWTAMLRQDWNEAIEYWSLVRTHAPDRPDGYIWAARSLWQSGRLDEATAMAAAAAERFPNDPDALAELAWVAVARRDWLGALRHWSLLRRNHPDRVDSAAGSSQALRMTGQGPEAEAVIDEALARHPEAADLLIEHVWTAVARDDWTAAAVRLETVRHGLNDARRFEANLGWVDEQLRTRQRAAASRAPAVPPQQMRAALPADHPGALELMLAFENLGERCDFGSVQRRFGAQPLGLLRFAFTNFEPLIAGLEDRFAAIGTAEDTGFELYNGENIIHMRKYGLIFHTFSYQSEQPTPEKRAAFRSEQLRRLGFLKNKLITDLEDSQKIFVYSTDERNSDADVARLFSAVRAFGPNSLLYVRRSDDGHPVGTVEQLQDGLYAGYFPGLTDFLTGAQPPFDVWHQLCEQTRRLKRLGRR